MVGWSARAGGGCPPNRWDPPGWRGSIDVDGRGGDRCDGGLEDVAAGRRRVREAGRREKFGASRGRGMSAFGFESRLVRLTHIVHIARSPGLAEGGQVAQGGETAIGWRGGGRSITAATAAPTTAAAAAVAATATAVAATAAARLAGLGLVDRQATAVDFLVVQALNGRLRLGVTAHLHEAEPLAPTRVAILDDLCALHGPVKASTDPYHMPDTSRSRSSGSAANLPIVMNDGSAPAKKLGNFAAAASSVSATTSLSMSHESLGSFVTSSAPSYFGKPLRTPVHTAHQTGTALPAHPDRRPTRRWAHLPPQGSIPL